VNLESAACDFTWLARDQTTQQDFRTIMGAVNDADGDDVIVGNEWISD